MLKTTQLRNLIHSNKLNFLMEAHNGLSARIVEEAGFEGIWASGLSISASLGLRDNNEASWTQVLDVIEYMSDATNIPIMLDGDTGYGNFNNMCRLVKKLEQRDIAGVCIEDKIFPKTNSFLRGEAQPLADIGEFCGKIKAGKDSQKNSDFVIVARTESLIAGRGIDEALLRAEKYYEAGADAILIHSKSSKADEVFDFIVKWDNKCPIVVVPTKYYTTPTSEFEKRNVSLIIWANHLVRSSIRSMQDTACQIYKEKTLINIEGNISSVQEVFRLQRDNELLAAEARYLPIKKDKFQYIVLPSFFSSLNCSANLKKIPNVVSSFNSRAKEKNINSLNKHGVFQSPIIISSREYDLLSIVDEIYHRPASGEYGYIFVPDDIVVKSSVLANLLNDDADISLLVDYGSLNTETNKYFRFKKSICGDNLTPLYEADFSKDYDHLDKATCLGAFKLSAYGLSLISNRDIYNPAINNNEGLDFVSLIKRLSDRGVKISIQLAHGQWTSQDDFILIDKDHASVL
ncbi:phosphoenolpyruvate mutase [Pantoea ananatis]|uniref:phosphoenolpyruvate mutase n=1 Tax=Pantoea ananas TaxID=553 RepID=UPI00090702EE|nr:phosphoenolpyruvate mutase [Pantoea ananatis]MDF7791698.1 phosphoenolpyruvate mutase [Pantoea ananatis]